MSYSIVYADPPWNFTDGFWDRSVSDPSNHYATMSTNDICLLNVPAITNKNCHLYMWTTSRHLMNGDAVRVVESWGFRPMNIITWCKTSISLGYYFRNSTEHLIFGIKGKLHTLDRKQPTHIIAPRERHSKKPDIFRDMIIRCSGDLPRIELFARSCADGWDVFGNEIEGGVVLPLSNNRVQRTR